MITTVSIIRALEAQGVQGQWTGDPPASADMITQPYLDEIVDEAPRFQLLGGVLDLVQLKADIDVTRRDELKEQVNEERDDRLASLTVTMDAVVYDADAAGRENLNGIVAAISASVPVPEPVNWRSADNVTRSLTHAKLIELAGLMITAVQTTYETSWNLKAQIDAAPDLAGAQSVTWP